MLAKIFNYSFVSSNNFCIFAPSIVRSPLAGLRASDRHGRRWVCCAFRRSDREEKRLSVSMSDKPLKRQNHGKEENY
jgi:hypothetical protein